MKKTNLLLFLFTTILLFGACESQTEKNVMEELSVMNGQIKVLPLVTQTRGGDQYTPYWAVGEKVGLFIQTDKTLDGPLPFTIANLSGGISFAEAIPFIDRSSRHTFYAYHPYEVNTSADPTTINVSPIGKEQVQQGTSRDHISAYEFNIATPSSIFPDEDLLLYFTSTYSFFQFQIRANVDGLVVKSIKVEAPTGKLINFTDAKVDITLPEGDPGFAKYVNINGGTSTNTLKIEDGGLVIPSTGSDHAIGYMVFNPFDCSGEVLKITVTTEDNQVFTFEEKGEDYIFGQHYEIPLYLEAKAPQPTVRDIKILSICEVGCLGTKDNTEKWSCYYGALNLHGKEIRRLLFEHFGKGKTVETGVISFEKIDHKCYLNKVTDAYLDQFSIIYLNNNARPDIQTSQKIMNWLNRSDDRVLMLAYDWKTDCLTPDMSESSIICKIATNYLVFRDHIYGVKPHWYNSSKVNQSIGNWGRDRDDMLLPFELNAQTRYFWKDGPFKTDLTEQSDLRYWVQDDYWGIAEVSDPNVIPLISYRDAKDDCYQTKTHKYGEGDGGMVLGVDPTKRIVYIGDSEIFSVSCVTSKVAHARMSKEGTCKPNEMNNYSKVMGNLWAWMIDKVIQQN